LRVRQLGQLIGIALILICGLSASPRERISTTTIVVWSPGPTFPDILLAVPANMTPFQAAQSYLSSILSEPSLQNFHVEKARVLDSPLYFKFRSLNSFPEDRAFMAVIANEFFDLLPNPKGKRMQDILNQFKNFGVHLIVVPPVFDIHLSSLEAEESRNIISTKFDAMLALGGDIDIWPGLYGETPIQANSKAFNVLQDISEVTLVRQYIQAKEGVMLGICRGHQMCAVAQGEKLIQDLPSQTDAQIGHVNGTHKIRIDKDSQLYRIFGREEIMVNTYHHQAVRSQSSGFLADGSGFLADGSGFLADGSGFLADGSGYTPVAQSVDHRFPVIEAAEFNGSLGFSYQFHPELMRSAEGKEILRFMAEAAIERHHQKSQSQSSELLRQKNKKNNCAGYFRH